jgi:putative transposase
VASIYTNNRGCYGSPRVHVELRERGHCVGRKRVARLMREQGFRARHKRRYRRTTDSRHNFPISANVLARRFAVMRPNAAWVNKRSAELVSAPKELAGLSTVVEIKGIGHLMRDNY